VTGNRNRPSKSVRARLRELGDLAYARELVEPFDELRDSLEGWRSGDITAADMRKRVRECGRGPLRGLDSLYRRLDPEHVVARALVTGILDPEEVEAAVIEWIAPAVRDMKILLDR
jgi:hypothetical protein